MSRPTKAIKEKKEEDEKQQLDRRKISESSKQDIAEAIESGNSEKALRKMFEVISGDTIKEALNLDI